MKSTQNCQAKQENKGESLQQQKDLNRLKNKCALRRSSSKMIYLLTNFIFHGIGMRVRYGYGVQI